MTKQELIKAIVLRRDYRFTHDELMRMNKAQLRHIYNGGYAILKVPKYPLSVLGDLLNNPIPNRIIESNKENTKKHINILTIQNYVHESKENNLSCDTTENHD